MSAAIFDDLAGQLETVLDGGLRRSCVDALAGSSATMGDALGQLRLAMRTHTWKGEGRRVVLVKSVQACDLLTQDELRRLAPPTLLIWGKRDLVQPPEQLAFFKAHLPAHAALRSRPGRCRLRLLRGIRRV